MCNMYEAEVVLKAGVTTLAGAAAMVIRNRRALLVYVLAAVN